MGRRRSFWTGEFWFIIVDHWQCCYRPEQTEDRIGYRTSSKLIIRQFSSGDVGTYQCVSSNSLGSDQEVIRIYGNKNSFSWIKTNWPIIRKSSSYWTCLVHQVYIIRVHNRVIMDQIQEDHSQPSLQEHLQICGVSPQNTSTRWIPAVACKLLIICSGHATVTERSDADVRTFFSSAPRQCFSGTYQYLLLAPLLLTKTMIF